MTFMHVKEAGEKLPSLIDGLTASHEPIHIKGPGGAAVLVGEDDWRAIQETLHLLSVPGVRESLLEGMKTPSERCATELDW